MKKTGAAVGLLPPDEKEVDSGVKATIGYRATPDQFSYVQQICKESGWKMTRVMIYLVDIARHIDQTLGAVDSRRVAELARENHLTMGQMIARLVQDGLSVQPKRKK